MKKVLTLLLMFSISLYSISFYQIWRDKYITFKIKKALYFAKGINAFKINVDTYNGIVYLRGKVNSREAYHRAVEIAKKIRGVKRVIPQLVIVKLPKKVKNKTHRYQKLFDPLITAQIKTAMYFNQNTNASRIKVTTKNGIVYLSGIVYSKREYEIAEKIAKNTLGVKKVVNFLKIIK